MPSGGRPAGAKRSSEVPSRNVSIVSDRPPPVAPGFQGGTIATYGAVQDGQNGTATVTSTPIPGGTQYTITFAYGG